MKKILIVLGLAMMVGAANAACPSGWEEVPMENTTIITSGSCPSGTESYYQMDSMCNANVL